MVDRSDTENGFTSGPWEAEPTPSSLFVTRAIYARREDGPDVLIAHVGLPGYANVPSVHEDVANAQLMCASKDMLNALKVIQSYGCPVCSGDCGSANPPVMNCPMKTVNTAIRKATGK